MIDGCTQWQAFGLAPPETVTEATREYLSAQDTVKNWLDECCMKDPAIEVESSKLFASWKLWCDANGEYAGSNKTLTQKLTDQGYAARGLAPSSSAFA
jgi:putative DNA primase/helicase